MESRPPRHLHPRFDIVAHDTPHRYILHTRVAICSIPRLPAGYLQLVWHSRPTVGCTACGTMLKGEQEARVVCTCVAMLFSSTTSQARAAHVDCRYICIARSLETEVDLAYCWRGGVGILIYIIF